MLLKGTVATTISFLVFSSPVFAYYYDDGYYQNDSYYDNYNYSYSEPSYYDSGYRSQKYYGSSRKKAKRSNGVKYSGGNYSSRLPQRISSSQNTIVVDPRVHAWGAYSGGQLIKSGVASAGKRYCPDIRRGCKTKSGYFRIQSLGSAGCKSTRYPVGRGGAPMPYCMYFSGNFALHGSYEVGDGNFSHGCVRLRVDDAKWLRYNFAQIGTPVIVKAY